MSCTPWVVTDDFEFSPKLHDRTYGNMTTNTDMLLAIKLVRPAKIFVEQCASNVQQQCLVG